MRLYTCLIFLFLMGTALFCFSDTIYLKDGSIIKGKISSQDENIVIIETSLGAFKIDKKNILKIEFDQQFVKITLKDGSILKGFLIGQTDNEIKIKLDSLEGVGEVIIQKDKVLSLEYIQNMEEGKTNKSELAKKEQEKTIEPVKEEVPKKEGINQQGIPIFDFGALASYIFFTDDTAKKIYGDSIFMYGLSANIIFPSGFGIGISGTRGSKSGVPIVSSNTSINLTNNECNIDYYPVDLSILYFINFENSSQISPYIGGGGTICFTTETMNVAYYYQYYIGGYLYSDGPYYINNSTSKTIFGFHFKIGLRSSTTYFELRYSSLEFAFDNPLTGSEQRNLGGFGASFGFHF